ncbi:hypothetical protein [Clostridium moutaii]|uniref:hypothetical protein n=1 Tax=Clostridium moutaii TaxID=3240932 RepID=UPI003510301F
MKYLDFDNVLKIMLSIAFTVQFFLSFIKRRSFKKDYGKNILKLEWSGEKRKALSLIFIGLVTYIIYILVTGYFSTLSVLIVAYILISIYDFSKIKIITSEGIGEKSFYSNVYYNFIYWENILQWKWLEDKKNILIFKSKVKNKVETNDWKVLPSEIKEIEKCFSKNAFTSENQDPI